MNHHMISRLYRRAFGLLSFFSALVVQATQPNVVMILVDDLGWQDVKCYDVAMVSHI